MTFPQKQPDQQAEVQEPVDAAPDDAQAGEQQPGNDAGPQPVEDIGFNQDVQNILWSRIQAMTPQEVQALDQIVTPQTYPILMKLFPELKLLLEQSTSVKGAQPAGPIQAPQGPAPAGAAPMTPGVSKGLMG